MGEHDCIQEKEIGRMTAVLERICKEVYGNGEVGLAKSIPRMEEKINSLNGSVASHTAVVARLLEFQATLNGEKNAKRDEEDRKKIAETLAREKEKDVFFKKIQTIGIVIAFLAMGSGMFFGFQNLKKQNNMLKSDMDLYMNPYTTRGLDSDSFKSDSLK